MFRLSPLIVHRLWYGVSAFHMLRKEDITYFKTTLSIQLEELLGSASHFQYVFILQIDILSPKTHYCLGAGDEKADDLFLGFACLCDG